MLLVVVSALLLMHGARTEDLCTDPHSRSMEFSLTTQKDKAGRWVADVELQQDSEMDKWKVDIKETSVGCPGSPTVKLVARLTAPPPKPGPGYEFHSGLGYYKIHSNKKTWQEAKDICAAEGGHLIILNSDAEAQICKQLWATIPENQRGVSVFVGFHDMHTEGRYITIFDEPLETTGFAKWATGQPDNAGASATHPGEDCGSMYMGTVVLNDLPCTNQEHFICEIELTS